MRLSTRVDDPGYSLIHFGTRVFLDGAEMERVFTADEEQGLVVVVDVDEDGRIRIKGGEVQTKTLQGSVRIELPANVTREWMQRCQTASRRALAK